MSSRNSSSQRKGLYVDGIRHFIRSLSSPFHGSLNNSHSKLVESSQSLSESIDRRFNSIEESIFTETIEDRCKATKELTLSLDNYPVQDILRIWNIANKNLSEDIDESLREVTLLLLEKCIRLDSTNKAKRFYYLDIVRTIQFNGFDPIAYLYFRCLFLITDGGKRIFNLSLDERMPISDFLSNSLDIAITNPNEKTRKALLKLIEGCLNSNFLLFDYAWLQHTLSVILKIASSAKSSQTLRLCLQCINYYSIQQLIPSTSLQPIVIILSSSRMVDDDTIKDLSLSALKNIWKIPGVGYHCFNIICDIVGRKVELDNTATARCTIGCIRFLEFGLFQYSQKSKVGHVITKILDSSVSYMLTSLYATAKRGNVTLSIEILKLVLKLLELPLISKHRFSLSKRTALWALLDSLGLDSQSNLNEPYKQILVELFNKLQNLNDDSAYIENITRYLESNSSILTSYNVKFILQSYRTNLRCVSSSPSWSQKCLHIIHEYYAKSPIEVTNFLQDSFTNSMLINNSKSLSDTFYHFLIDSCLVSNPNSTLPDEFVPFLASVVSQIPEDKLMIYTNNLFSVMESVSQENQRRISEALVLITILLCLHPINSDVLENILHKMLDITDQSLATNREEIFLTFARCFMAIRPTRDENYLCFSTIDNIEDMCAMVCGNQECKIRGLSSITLWQYPEHQLAYLPQEILQSNRSSYLTKNSKVLERWDLICIKVLKHIYSWDIYSYILSHFGDQIGNGILSFLSLADLKEFIQFIGISSTRELPGKLQFYGVGNIRRCFLRYFPSLIYYKPILGEGLVNTLTDFCLLNLEDSKYKDEVLNILYVFTYGTYDIVLKRFDTLLESFASPNSSSSWFYLFLRLPEIGEFSQLFSEDQHLSCLKSMINVISITEQKLSSSGASLETFHDGPEMLKYKLLLAYSSLYKWTSHLTKNKKSDIIPKVIQAMRKQIHGIRDTTFIDFLEDLLKNNEHTVDDDNPSFQLWYLDGGILSVQLNQQASFVDLRRSDQHVKCKLHIEPSSKDDSNLFYHHVLDPLSDPEANFLPLNLPESTLDRIDNISVVDNHNVGILYLAPGQKCLDTLLQNKFGSPAYQKFLREINDCHSSLHFKSNMTSKIWMESKIRLYWNESGLCSEQLKAYLPKAKHMDIFITLMQNRNFVEIKSFRNGSQSIILPFTHIKLIPMKCLPNAIYMSCLFVIMFYQALDNNSTFSNWESRSRLIKGMLSKQDLDNGLS